MKVIIILVLLSGHVASAKMILNPSLNVYNLNAAVKVAIEKYYREEFNVDINLSEIFDLKIDSLESDGKTTKVVGGVGVPYLRDSEGGIPDWCNYEYQTITRSVTSLGCSSYD